MATYVPVNIQQAFVSFNELRAVVAAGTITKNLNTVLGHGGNVITFGGSCLTDEITPIGSSPFVGFTESGHALIQANRGELELGLDTLLLAKAQLTAVRGEAEALPMLPLVLQIVLAGIALWRQLLGKGE